MMLKPSKLISIPGNSSTFDPPDLPGALRRLAAMNGRENSIDGLPFIGDDVTAGAENELQVVVAGRREDVDLPASILDSNYFANILRRARVGDTSSRLADRLEIFLQESREQIWENSWVRFPRRNLCPASDAVFRHDLVANLGQGGDAGLLDGAPDSGVAVAGTLSGSGGQGGCRRPWEQTADSQ